MSDDQKAYPDQGQAYPVGNPYRDPPPGVTDANNPGQRVPPREPQ